MMGNPGIHILSEAQWAALEPLIDEVRPHCKVPHEDLRQTIEAILWRHQTGAKWRGVPSELGPWWKAAQTFIRWARLGVWERLLLGPARRLGAPAAGPGSASGSACCWARLGVWERLLDLVQQRGVALGMTFLDGTNIRAHQKAAGAEKGGPTARSATAVKRLAALVAATAPRPA
jgi:transposase